MPNTDAENLALAKAMGRRADREEIGIFTEPNSAADVVVPLRPGLGVAEYQAQTTWSVDESNITGLASDQNTGISDASPLLTLGELLQRVGPRWRLPGVVTVRWLSNATTVTANLSHISSNGVADFIVFQGVPTVVQSGTLTAGTAAGAGNAAPILEDTALASTWIAAGGISNATRGRLIRRVGANVRGWLSKDLGAKQARVSWASDAAESNSLAAQNAASFASGNAYEVLSLPEFPQIISSDVSPNSIRFLLLNINGGALSLNRGQQASFILCSFNTFANFFLSGTCVLKNCCSMGGFSFSGLTVLPNFCLFGGTCQATGFRADWNTLTNTFQGAGIAVAHGSNIDLSGTLHVYDSAAAVVVVTLSKVGLQAVHGSGNTGLIVDVQEPGCKAVSRTSWSGIDATTSAPKPLAVIATTYDYADAVAGTAQSQVKDAGFFG